MSSLEARMQKMEDRLALQDLILAYCNQIDNSAVDNVVDCFTGDALLDLTGLGLSKLHGHQEIREFFSSVFSTMAHNAHYSTNFTVDRLEADSARCYAYVFAVGIANDGGDVLVHAKHEIDCVRTEKGWKIKRFSEPYLIPPKEEIPAF